MKYQQTKVAFAFAAALGGVALMAGMPAGAQDIVRFVTGSNLPRTETEGALPVQVITKEEIARTGTITTQDLLLLISANQSSGALNTTNATGATTFSQQAASLRGLGSQRTLVLVNGVRVAGFAGTIQGTGGVDLNAIPTSAIDRVEVLKDGASAVYGSDAIGGVINFILRQDFTGYEATGYYGAPTRSGGGKEWQAKATGGWGDLTKDRYNLFVSAYYTEQEALLLRDRNFGKTSYIPDIGLFGVSGQTFPAYVSTRGSSGARVGSVGYPNCPNPYSGINDPPNLGERCFFDPSEVAQAIPELKQTGAYAAGRFQINSDWQAYLNGSYTKSENNIHIQPTPISDAFPTDPGSPADLAGYDGSITVHPTSPYYPVAAATAVGANGLPLNVRYRCVECGDRLQQDTTEQWGLVGGVTGAWKGWDINAVGWYNESKNIEATRGGYVFQSKVLPILNSDAFNPFGPNTAATTAAILATQFNGDVWTATSKIYGGDVRASGEIYKLPAGSLALAVGVSGWKEQFDQASGPALASGDLTGYGGNILGVTQSRNVGALYAELGVPIMKNLEGTIAVRYDHYSDFGSTTNPKVSLRWQPMKELVLRGSYGTGFMAPNLYQLYVPNTTGVSTPGLSDPLRCPTTNDTPDCLTQFGVIFGGNTQLKPEESFQVNAGFVIEPVRGLSLSLDWFKVNIYQGISNGPSPEVILDDLAQFGNLVTRGPVQPAFPTLPGPIINIDQRYINLGTLKLTGIDGELKFVFPKLDWGQLMFTGNGTYFIKYDVQQLDGSFAGFVSQQAGSATSGVTPRFKSYLQLNWQLGPWGATLGNTYQSGYGDVGTDINDEPRRVGSLSLWDLNLTYSGFKNMVLTLGARNLLDTNPPLTNQQTTFQGGYDPTYYDARARFVYGQIAYTFK